MDRDELERIAAPHNSKAAKVRALNEAGVSTTDISNFLQIRYQHTYNVLLRAGRITRPEPKEADAGAPLLMLEVDARGAVTLPDEILRSFNVTDGGRIFCRQTPQGLLLIPHDEAVAELRRLAAERMPEHASLLDVLLGSKPRSSSAELLG
ncbi:AbrB/MazE/SpoVT family DNA-binding domain-containing protein [Sphingomonas phyllosphaerae]|uniref:AbrB/MazE/SpoVT family DNA-binding domain-containing protein n=1 Tax=Sphingomonas phyllosphaerae TaxID=257003 RepID=UPI0003B6FF6B|nr:AbrB/MazE/SpoVT family DNA-binding domain-containing protein [Sphingomonas phyllosphaerae]